MQTLGEGTREEWRAAAERDARDTWNARAALRAPAQLPPGWRIQKNDNGSIGLFAPPPVDGESRRTSECFTGKLGNDMNEIVFKLLTHMLASHPLPALAPLQVDNPAARDVLAERRRQVESEGWDAKHDDEHDSGEMASAASAYALAAADKLHPMSQGDGEFDKLPPAMWCWDHEWWKPGEPRRMLVKAGALILAEIDRLDREQASKTQAGVAHFD
jgi:hypothetical protein